jgi:hypothetical protein
MGNEASKSKGGAAGGGSPRDGAARNQDIQKMDRDLRRKLGKGSQYNRCVAWGFFFVFCFFLFFFPHPPLIWGLCHQLSMCHLSHSQDCDSR